MSGPCRWACAAVVGVALAVAVGCKVTDSSLFAVIQAEPGRDHVITAPLETVVASLQANLSGLGLVAVVTPEGEAVRIRSTSISGQRFSFLLTRVKMPSGEQTKIHVEWEGKPDAQTEARVLGTAELKKAP
jgi:hypothetical protein